MASWNAQTWQEFLDKGGGLTDFSQPSWVPPSLHGDPAAKSWASKHKEFLGVGADVTMLIAIFKLKGKLIQGAGRFFWLFPAVAFFSALATIIVTEHFVGSKKAEDLSKWYANAVTDPYAWHIETDRVVQGAANTLIADFSEGVSSSPEVAGEIGAVAWYKFWASDQAQAGWRRIGSGL